MKRLYWIYPQDGGCSFHRILQPARFCQDHYKDEWEFLVGPGAPGGHDVYYFNGLPNTEQSQGTIMTIVQMKRAGAKFVWGIDDDWTCIPPWNPAKPNEAGLCAHALMKDLADHVIVSTDHLASTFADVKHKLSVCPNLLDLANYLPVSSEEFADEDGRRGKRYQMSVETPVRVVWSGSETHRGDWDDYTDVLDEFLDRYAGFDRRAVVVFCGMSPHPRLVRKYLHRGLFHQPSVPFVSYQTVLNSLNPHVYLAPLAKVPFNLSKSNLRVLEGWALMAPSVATDYGEYSSIASGVDGFTAATPEAFYTHLVKLVTDHEFRVACASRGRMRLEQRYNWNEEACRRPWYAALDRILEV